MRSSPACASRSSSLPNAFTENGQVGSRNTSNTRGPWPQTRGSARHVVCFIRSFLFARFSRTKSAGADELWGGKLRGAILSRAAHIVFLRIQVKYARGSGAYRRREDGPNGVRSDAASGSDARSAIQFENWLALPVVKLSICRSLFPQGF